MTNRDRLIAEDLQRDVFSKCTESTLVVVLPCLCSVLGWLDPLVQAGIARDSSRDSAVSLYHRHIASLYVLPCCTAIQVKKSAKGIFYAVLMGVLAGFGGLTLFAAYHTEVNTSLSTAVTAIYPMVTVVLALSVLHEKLRRIQIVGLVFACIALVIFSM